MENHDQCFVCLSIYLIIYISTRQLKPGVLLPGIRLMLFCFCSFPFLVLIFHQSIKYTQKGAYARVYSSMNFKNLNTPVQLRKRTLLVLQKPLCLLITTLLKITFILTSNGTEQFSRCYTIQKWTLPMCILWCLAFIWSFNYNRKSLQFIEPLFTKCKAL